MLALKRAFSLAEALLAIGLALMALFLVLGTFLQSYRQSKLLGQQAEAYRRALQWRSELPVPPLGRTLGPVQIDGIEYRGAVQVLDSGRLLMTVEWSGQRRQFPLSTNQ